MSSIYSAIRYDIGIAIHGVMFIPTIERLGTDAQISKWLPLAMTLNVIGTYAQTEMGHGKRQEPAVCLVISINQYIYIYVL